MKWFNVVAVAAVAAGLVGCGGGGSSTTTAPATPAAVASTNSFALLAGYKAYVSSAATNKFTITGDCTGTGTVTDAAPVASSFEGVAGKSQTTTTALTLATCLGASTGGASSPTQSVTYYDNNLTPVGDTSDGAFSKFSPAATPLPVSVKVGDSGVIGTELTYTNSTKLVYSGSSNFTYTVEADTATTVIVNLTSKSYDSANKPTSVQQSRYRIAADGTLSVVSIDLVIYGNFGALSSLRTLLTRV